MTSSDSLFASKDVPSSLMRQTLLDRELVRPATDRPVVRLLPRLCVITIGGRSIMDRGRLRCVINMHLADSREQAVADIRYGCEEFVRYFNNNQPRFDVPEGADYVDWVLDIPWSKRTDDRLDFAKCEAVCLAAF